MKTAIVTGAAGNLGHAVSEKFLEAGYRVIGTVFPGHPAKITDRNFEGVGLDLTNEENCAAFVQTIINSQEQLDVAVLTAGGFGMGNITDTKTSDLVKQLQLNVETAYNIARPVFTQMLKQGSGRIFLVGSRPGSDMTKSKGMVAYGMSKSLLFRLAELMNDEAKSTDVVTTVVVPSTIDTIQNRKQMPDSDYKKWVKPEAIAAIILEYCSPLASVIREPVLKLYNAS
jgi:NAD(P)-dependent dehydrogenase (short-subunit alcohol dehydrogenase family)